MTASIFRYKSVLKMQVLLLISMSLFQCTAFAQTMKTGRERILLNEGWKFYKYQADQPADNLIYDVRPSADVDLDKIAADARPTEAVKMTQDIAVLKQYILPTGNEFIADASKRFKRPAGNPGADFPFVKTGFDDRSWESVNLPHDWAIKGPFYTESRPVVGGGMGRLPIQGVGWYRRKINIPASDAGKSVYLDIDGAMSYAMVWLNGKLVGGWPYGYASWRVDLTPYLIPGGANQLAIRIDNPVSSSRWYPGAGIYRNVWLTKVHKIQVAQWGTFIKTSNVSAKSAKVELEVKVDNKAKRDEIINILTQIYLRDQNGKRSGKPVATMLPQQLLVKAGSRQTITTSVIINQPKLWYPLPKQQASGYIAVTSLGSGIKQLDTYETPFGIRDIRFDPEKGLFVNGEHFAINGVNQHSDLGALGMAFNERAAERQLEKLAEMGSNAIRMSHNPPAPELLDLADRMGFLVIDELFDSWERKKTPLDFHLIFPDWSEQDLRALIRRDRNHPSVILWSFGNEVGEQYTDTAGALIAKRLYNIAQQEDPTRLKTIAMNYSKPDMPLPAEVDVIGLNYQGEGIRDAAAYAGLKGITSGPMFPAFHQKFPEKVILSTENAAAISSRGAYMFPVNNEQSSPVKDTLGGDPRTHQVSAYELYSVDFGASADKVFATMAKHPFVAGGFVWTGWDYIGEPTPYYSSRSSYFGIIDLAGFKKDRFYLYQSQWQPDLAMVHLLPHWNWPQRTGEITPVHVFTSGDEAELFLNGKSLGRKKLKPYEYRLRWDDVRYEPGELQVIAYKNGKRWAEDKRQTTGMAQKLSMVADRSAIKSDGKDLSFITLEVRDQNGLLVPDAMNGIEFSISGPGEIVATDNGDATSFVSFSSKNKQAFNGLCLVIVRAKPNQPGNIIIAARSKGLESVDVIVKSF